MFETVVKRAARQHQTQDSETKRTVDDREVCGGNDARCVTACSVAAYFCSNITAHQAQKSTGPALIRHAIALA